MQPNPLPDHRRDILLLVFSITGFLLLFGRGIYLLTSGFTSGPFFTMNDSDSRILDAIGMFFCSTLLLPLFILCIRKLKGREIPPVKLPAVKFWQAALFAAAWLVVIFLGSVLETRGLTGGLAASPFFLLGISMPVAGLVWIAISGLPAGSWRRLWAVFGIGMVGSTLGAILVEYALVGIAALTAGIVAASNPEWLAIFQQVKSQVSGAGDVQSLLTTLAPYLTNPLVLLLALVFAAGLAPVIEETIKPAALWLVGKRLGSPAEGFALGALCGAGFALFEGSLAASGSPQMPGVGIAGRAASSLMHITASGLTGWGIASALLQKRYGRMAGMYFLSLGLHGLWNGSVVMAVFGSLRLSLPGGGNDPSGMLLILAGIGILGSLLVTIMVLLPLTNHFLRPGLPLSDKPPQGDIIAPLPL